MILSDTDAWQRRPIYVSRGRARPAPLPTDGGVAARSNFGRPLVPSLPLSDQASGLLGKLRLRDVVCVSVF